jgi:hypothetical protein
MGTAGFGDAALNGLRSVRDRSAGQSLRAPGGLRPAEARGRLLEIHHAGVFAALAALAADSEDQQDDA